MAGSATNDKIIRIRSDINQAIQDAHKLQSAYTSLSGVNPALAAMVNNLNGAQVATSRITGATQAANNNVRTLTGNLGGLGQAAQAALSQLSGMTGMMGGIATAGMAIGVTAGVGALVALGTAAVKASAEFQQYRASLTTVLGDTDKASQAFDRLVQFAQKTPFSLNQSVEGFIKLKALGLQPTESAMMSYGNTASAMGKDLNQMVEAVADAATGEFERLKEFGIKAKQNGDQVSLTFQGVTKTVGNNSQEIQKYLLAIGNTQFAGAMDKQMQTFGGAMSNLEDTWNQTLAAIGDDGLTSSVANIVNMITSGLSSITPILVAIGNVMGGVLDGVASIASGIGALFSGLTSNGSTGLTFIETFTVALNVVGQTASVMGSIIGAAFGAVGQVVGGVIGTVRGWFASLWEWLGISTSQTTSNMGLSFIGVLRAAKFMAENLPKMFSAALGAIGGMFSIIGQRVAAFFSGDWNAFSGIGSVLYTQFHSADAVIGGIVDKAGKIATDTKGAADAWERLKGGGPQKGGATLDQLAGTAPVPGKQPGKSDKDAAKAGADRAKREAEYWQALKDQLATAELLTNQAEVHTKQVELRKIVERDLTAIEQQRVAAAIGEINSAKSITSLKQKLFEAQNEYTVELGRGKNLTDAMKSVEDELFKARLDALNKGVDINSTLYKQAEDGLRKQLEKNVALKEQNELLKRATDFGLSMSEGARARNDLKKLDADYKAWKDAVAKGDLPDTFRDQIVAGYQAAKVKIEQDAIRLVLDMSSTASRAARADSARADYRSAMAQLDKMSLSADARKQIEGEIYTTYHNALGKIESEVTRDWIDMFDDLADFFGGRLGSVLKRFGDGFDNIARMMSGELTGPAGFLAKILNRQGTYSDSAKGFGIEAVGDALKNPLKSLSDGFGDFKSMFSGDLATGLVKGLTKMQAGAQIGGMVAGVGDLLGLGKGFSTGANIGGTLGGLFGPVGSIIGSLGGGILGSIFGPKPKYGTASLTGPGDASLSGNAGSVKSAASGAAGEVQQGLADLAAQLGGTVGSYSLAIGQWNGRWRVNDNATSKALHSNNFGPSTLHDFGDDQASAIAYAIQNAIADGAITGLAPIIQKALGALGTESAIQFAKDWKAAMDDYKSLTDPVTAAVESILTPLNTLRDTMVKVGASTDELTKIDDYRTLKLKAALKEQLSSLTDFLAALKGEGSGVTKLDQLNSKMTEFEAYRTRIANGDSSVDQAAFTALGQSIFSLAGDIYGTATSEFQDIRAALTGASQGLADNITKAFNAAAGYDVSTATVTSIDNTTVAIQSQTAAAQAYYDAQVASNARVESYLKQLVDNSNSGTSNVKAFANDDVAINGVYQGRTY